MEVVFGGKGGKLSRMILLGQFQLFLRQLYGPIQLLYLGLGSREPCAVR